MSCVGEMGRRVWDTARVGSIHKAHGDRAGWDGGRWEGTKVSLKLIVKAGTLSNTLILFTRPWHVVAAITSSRVISFHKETTADFSRLVERELCLGLSRL